ncbi:hypothetical protein K2173_020196 [Erythroxylum novogranatense]|uniref:Calmodulin-binding domain-containing protein n=1 Tax=Erythroxylum novogranatense TaxID=1862640 RepID=A0AAV8U792_9ROSI|nr:hypothetical protein K2173_020196 [Erythroxylum novogranatense]
MAEKSTSLPVSPMSNDMNQVKPRRSSLGNLSSARNGEKLLPSYLRASTGSCHDHCKYGGNHKFEEKARHPMRRILKKSPDDHGSVEVQPERGKTLTIKIKPSAKSKTVSASTPEVGQEVPTKSIDNKTSLFNKVLTERTSDGTLLTKSLDWKIPLSRVVVTKQKKQGVLAYSVDGQSSVSSETFDDKKKKKLDQENKKTPVVTSKKSSDLKSNLLQKSTKQVLSSSKKLEISLEQSSFKAKQVNYSAKFATSSLSSSGKAQASVKMSSSKAKEINAADDHVSFSSKAKEINAADDYASSLKFKLSSPGTLRDSSAKKNNYVKNEQMTGSSKEFVKRISSHKNASSGVAIGLASPRASLRVAGLNARKSRGLKVVSSVKNQNRLDIVDTKQPKPEGATHPDLPKEDAEVTYGDEVREKTLHVIKMETENKYLESDCNENIYVESSQSPLALPESQPHLKPCTPSTPDEDDERESDYNISETEYDSHAENGEIEQIEEAVACEGVNKLRSMRAGTTLSGHKEKQPVKLRFRRGKVVEIQSKNDSPRRLKFRRGKVLGDDKNLKADARIIFRMKAAEVATNESKADTEKVNLRHQDVHKKKDARGLFNNVIEETASKLVEARKSKVKALVGAFETVIFLQDGKPSPNVVS